MTTVFFAVTKWMSVALMFPAQGSARAGVPGAGRVSLAGVQPGAGVRRPFGNCRDTTGTGTCTYQRFWRISGYRRGLSYSGTNRVPPEFSRKNISQPIYRTAQIFLKHDRTPDFT